MFSASKMASAELLIREDESLQLLVFILLF